MKSAPLGQQLYIHTVFHTYFYCLCCQSHCFRKQRIGSETKEQSAYMQFCQILKKLLSKDIDSVLFIFKGFFQIGNQTPSTRFQEVRQSNIHSRSNNRHKNYIPMYRILRLYRQADETPCHFFFFAFSFLL